MLPIRRSGRESEWGTLRRFRFFLWFSNGHKSLIQKWDPNFKLKTEKTQISSYMWQNTIFSCLRKVFGPILLWRGFWDLISIFRPKTLQEKQLCLKLLEILWKPVGKGYLKVVFFAILHHRNIYPNSNAPFSQLFENCSITQTMSFHAPNFLFAVKVHPRKAGKDRSSQLYFMVQPDDLTWQSTVVSFSRDGHEWVSPWKQVEHFENNSLDWIDTCYKRRGEQPGWYQTSLHEQFLFGNSELHHLQHCGWYKITRSLRSTLENVHKRLGVGGMGDLQRRMFPTFFFSAQMRWKLIVKSMMSKIRLTRNHGAQPKDWLDHVHIFQMNLACLYLVSSLREFSKVCLESWRTSDVLCMNVFVWTFPWCHL